MDGSYNDLAEDWILVGNFDRKPILNWLKKKENSGR